MNLDDKTVDFAGKLLSQVGFPVLCAAYFLWSDGKFKAAILEKLTQILDRLPEAK